MKKTFLLRLARIFTALTAVAGISLHPASKLVDGVSGATRQKQHANNNTSDSDDSTISSDNAADTTSISNPPAPITNINPVAKPTITTGWLTEGGNWIYMRENGSRATGWLKDGNVWYYLSSNGIMMTGWVQTSGHWYYLANGGAMQTGWIKDNSGSWYYLDYSGAMLANTTVSGYQLGSDGRML
jgi:FOG: Glucan-binding domain (YG repeat)